MSSHEKWMSVFLFLSLSLFSFPFTHPFFLPHCSLIMHSCSIFILPATRMKDRVSFFFYLVEKNSWNILSRNKRRKSHHSCPQNHERAALRRVRVNEALGFYHFHTCSPHTHTHTYRKPHICEPIHHNL